MPTMTSDSPSQKTALFSSIIIKPSLRADTKHWQSGHNKYHSENLISFLPIISFRRIKIIDLRQQVPLKSTFNQHFYAKNETF